ncbi:tetratricopeptide repeat protein [Sulfurospirillum oryzae]|uniref:tetratricopeptide repeat protein n=1 Tax=Sulfurospirillum oryzae TaxID=2976535 RepID=UPI0021E8924E|nr:hypothetical protein [Sulfurospirillum oryzae]
MISVSTEHDRHVIPNWRSFGSTVSLGELDAYQTVERNFPKVYDIDEYIIDFQINKTTVHASELISAAIANNRLEAKEVEEAAYLILKNSDKVTSLQFDLAKQILSPELLHKQYINHHHEEDLLRYFEDHETRIKDKIKCARDSLKQFNFNPVLYVELSRYYSIIGEEAKSIHAMKIAMHLAKNNRFVFRCATRLFVHYHSEKNDYLEQMQRYLQKTPMVSHDPWLMSAEISLSTLLDRSSKFVKKGIGIIDSKNYAPFSLTELASNIATIEMFHGSRKRSKTLFKEALKAPNDNTLAQVKWALRKDPSLEGSLQVSLDSFDTKKKFEALTYDSYFGRKDFNETLTQAIHWLIDQPFSKDAAMFGSNIAATLVSDQDKAIALVKAGLLSHPDDPGLINNYAYSLSLDNRPDEALDMLNKMKASNIAEETKICLKATRGLALFRTRQHERIEEGRALYQEAISDTKKMNNSNLNWTAIINYAREELIHDSKNAVEIVKLLDMIPSETKNPSIDFLKSDLMGQCLDTMKSLVANSPK